MGRPIVVRLVLGLGLCACSTDEKGFGALSATDLRAQHCNASRAPERYAASVGTSGTRTTATAAGPIPCFQLTGHASSENTLAVLDDGTVLVAPVITADGTGILRSRDQGASWEVRLPAQHGGAVHQRVQPYMFLDPSTQRVLFMTAAGLGGDGFALSRSDDGADTFSAGTLGSGSVDWIKLAAGTPVSSTPSGRATRVLYASAPAPISTPTPFTNPEFQAVWRSLDGGESWSSVGGKALSLRPEDHGCRTGEWVIYGAGVVDTGGALHLGLRRCDRLGIATSHDEGATWAVRDVPGATLVAYGGLTSHPTLFNLMAAEPLATDSAGNLYALWNDAADVLRLAVSRDGGDSWSAPKAVAAPGVNKTVLAALAVKSPGIVAIAYYGSSDGGATYHGYVGETENALDATPELWSQRVSGDAPLFADRFDMGYLEGTLGGDLVEITEVRYAPNGDIWAAFVKDMCPGMDRSVCTWDAAAHANGGYQAAVARLVHP